MNMDDHSHNYMFHSLLDLDVSPLSESAAADLGSSLEKDDLFFLQHSLSGYPSLIDAAVSNGESRMDGSSRHHMTGFDVMAGQAPPSTGSRHIHPPSFNPVGSIPTLPSFDTLRRPRENNGILPNTSRNNISRLSMPDGISLNANPRRASSSTGGDPFRAGGVFGGVPSVSSHAERRRTDRSSECSSESSSAGKLSPPPLHAQRTVMRGVSASVVGGMQLNTSSKAAPAVKRSKSEVYERKKGRAKQLRLEIAERFEELQTLLLQQGSCADTTYIRDTGAKRSAILYSATQVIRALSAQVEASAAALALSNSVTGGSLSPNPSIGESTLFDTLGSGSLELNTELACGPLQLKRRRSSGSSSFSIPGVHVDDNLHIQQHNNVHAQYDNIHVQQDYTCGKASTTVLQQALALVVHAFLDPQSLETAAAVNREWRDRCRWDVTWVNLCTKRWKLKGEQLALESWRGLSAGMQQPPSWRAVYQNLHRNCHIPGGALTQLNSPHVNPSNGVAETVFGQSLSGGVCAWIALCRRSNGQTGRTILVDGFSARSAAVVEVRIIVQNINNSCGVFFPRQPFRFCAENSAGTFFVEPFGDPRYVSSLVKRSGKGGEPVRVTAGGWLETPLRLFEWAAFSAFICVPGCPTETDFLAAAESIDLAVNVLQGGGYYRPVAIPVRMFKSSKVSPKADTSNGNTCFI